MNDSNMFTIQFFLISKLKIKKKVTKNEHVQMKYY